MVCHLLGTVVPMDSPWSPAWVTFKSANLCGVCWAMVTYFCFLYINCFFII